MIELKATVKRDLCMWSLEAWRKGYDVWNHPATFVFDGERVHFYHLKSDFDRFKNEVTPKLLENADEFTARNTQFQKDIEALQTLEIEPWTLRSVSDLVGDIMSFYMFVVSDKVVEAKPEAWPSRRASEGILYEVDEMVRKLLERRLADLSYDPRLARVMTLDDIDFFFSTYQFRNRDEMNARLNGYILRNDEIATSKTFDEYCSEHEWVNPYIALRHSEQCEGSADELKGAVAFAGNVTGIVRIVRDAKDVKQFQHGEILVASMTNITWLPAMLIASAIITDEGGITCHAAITARELEKPCITGTKHATKILKTGDTISITKDGSITKAP